MSWFGAPNVSGEKKKSRIEFKLSEQCMVTFDQWMAHLGSRKSVTVLP